MNVGLALAASGAGGGGLLSELWPWLVALLLLVCVGAIAIHVVRRMLDRETTTPDEGFSLQDLRELHASGALTDEEFDRAKAAIIGRVAGDAEPEPPSESECCRDEPEA